MYEHGKRDCENKNAKFNSKTTDKLICDYFYLLNKKKQVFSNLQEFELQILNINFEKMRREKLIPSLAYVTNIPVNKKFNKKFNNFVNKNCVVNARKDTKEGNKFVSEIPEEFTGELVENKQIITPIGKISFSKAVEELNLVNPYREGSLDSESLLLKESLAVEQWFLVFGENFSEKINYFRRNFNLNSFVEKDVQCLSRFIFSEGKNEKFDHLEVKIDGNERRYVLFSKVQVPNEKYVITGWDISDPANIKLVSVVPQIDQLGE
jgi:hypothetical protein